MSRGTDAMGEAPSRRNAADRRPPRRASEPPWVGRSRGGPPTIVYMVAAIFFLLAGCGLRGEEPTDAQLRAIFEQHRDVLDELRRMFEDDSKAHRLRWISVSAENTGCEDRNANCIPGERWREYAARLRRAGIEQIETHETPGIYFHIHRSLPAFGWSGPYRSRGLVYAPGVPHVKHDHDDTEERVDLVGGWYSYLIIDD